MQEKSGKLKDAESYFGKWTKLFRQGREFLAPDTISANERNFLAPRAHYTQLIPPLKAKEGFLTLS